MLPTVFMLFVISISVLFAVNTAALMLSLYWVYPWLDIPMHALGGVTVALGYQSRFILSRYKHKLSFGFLATVGFVMLIGVLWEVYEFIVGPLLPGYLLDTLTDLVMDFLGGVLGYIVARAVIRL